LYTDTKRCADDFWPAATVPRAFSFSAAVVLKATNALMDASDLHRRARQAFEATSISQAEVARTLGLNRSSVSQALRGAGLRHPAVQARILSLLENEPVQRRSTYRAASVQHEWILGPQHWRVGGGYPWVRSHGGGPAP
jgi:predicted XRE-type DNA-binding protein